jgi:RNA polymerase sigma-70 factor (ECF subfamily)
LSSSPSRSGSAVPLASRGRTEPQSDRALEELLERIARGDEAAIFPFVRALRPALFSYCSSQLQDASAAEDATQEALCELLQKAPFYDSSKAVLPWAFTIARYACLTERRRRSRRRETAEGPLDGTVEDSGAFRSSEAADGEAVILAREALARAGTAFDALDTGARAAIVEALEPPAGDAPLDARTRKARQRAFEGFRTLFKRLYDG